MHFFTYEKLSNHSSYAIYLVLKHVLVTLFRAVGEGNTVVQVSHQFCPNGPLLESDINGPMSGSSGGQ